MMQRATTSRAASQFVAAWQRLEPVVAPWTGGIATALTLGVIAWELRDQNLSSLLSYIPVDPRFWLAIIASILIAPLAEWAILRRLEGIGREAMWPLIRKQSLNALIFGYAGDAYFMAWLQKRMGSARRAFSLTCDLAVVSSLANSAATIVMLMAMWTSLSTLAGSFIDVWSVSTMILIILIPAAILAWNRAHAGSIAGLGTIILFQGARTVAVSVLIALTWHYALPAVPLSSWLLLMAGRMVVSRIPIVPNKELAFLACASLFAGPYDEVTPMIASTSFLTLAMQAVLMVMTQGAKSSAS
jgi:hypothetical protein